MLAGFPTDELRTQHEMTHRPALFCTHSGCKYSLPFASQQNLRKHIRNFHDSRPKVVSKSIRRRQATPLRGQSGRAQTLNPLEGVDAHSQAQRRINRPSKLLQQNQAHPSSTYPDGDPTALPPFAMRRPHAQQLGSFELPPPPVHRYPFTNIVTTSQSWQDPTTISNLSNVQQNEFDPFFFDMLAEGHAGGMSLPEIDIDFTPPSRIASYFQYPLSNQTNTISPPEINIDFAPPSRSASLDRYSYEYEPSAVTQSVSQSNKPDIRPVPKFERTYSDIATDNFYEPSTFIQPRPVPEFERTYTDIAAENFYDPSAVIQSVSQLKPAQSSLLSPYRSNVSENVQRALQAAQYARSQSPSSNAAGSDSPFRQNSPYRPPSNRFNTPMNTAPPSVQASFGLPSRQMSPDRDVRSNQANVMSPPEINIDFAPPSRQEHSQPRDEPSTSNIYRVLKGEEEFEPRMIDLRMR